MALCLLHVQEVGVGVGWPTRVPARPSALIHTHQLVLQHTSKTSLSCSTQELWRLGVQGWGAHRHASEYLGASWHPCLLHPETEGLGLGVGRVS